MPPEENTSTPTASADTTDAGQGFRALTERWTIPRIERVVALLRKGNREALQQYLDQEVPRVPHATDPPDKIDLKGIPFDRVGYRVDLGQTDLRGLNFWSARFVNVNLKGAKFYSCTMGLIFFDNAYLRGAYFEDCDLHGCAFKQCNLQGLRLVKTGLRFSDFSDCELDVESFGDVFEEVRKGRWALARDVYKALRLNLTAMGDDTGAAWASYRESVMERKRLLDAGHKLKWLASWLIDQMWGYGHRPARLFGTALFVCFLFAIGYFFIGIKVEPTAMDWTTAPNKWDYFGECLYYSFVTFTTVEPSGLAPCNLGGRILTVTEAFGGIFTLGLFVTANVRKLEGR